MTHVETQSEQQRHQARNETREIADAKHDLAVLQMYRRSWPLPDSTHGKSTRVVLPRRYTDGNLQRVREHRADGKGL